MAMSDLIHVLEVEDDLPPLRTGFIDSDEEEDEVNVLWKPDELYKSYQWANGKQCGWSGG